MMDNNNNNKGDVGTDMAHHTSGATTASGSGSSSTAAAAAASRNNGEQPMLVGQGRYSPKYQMIVYDAVDHLGKRYRVGDHICMNTLEGQEWTCVIETLFKDDKNGLVSFRGRWFWNVEDVEQQRDSLKEPMRPSKCPSHELLACDSCDNNYVELITRKCHILSYDNFSLVKKVVLRSDYTMEKVYFCERQFYHKAYRFSELNNILFPGDPIPIALRKAAGLPLYVTPPPPQNRPLLSMSSSLLSSSSSLSSSSLLQGSNNINNNHHHHHNGVGNSGVISSSNSSAQNNAPNGEVIDDGGLPIHHGTGTNGSNGAVSSANGGVDHHHHHPMSFLDDTFPRRRVKPQAVTKDGGDADGTNAYYEPEYLGKGVNSKKGKKDKKDKSQNVSSQPIHIW